MSHLMVMVLPMCKDRPSHCAKLTIFEGESMSFSQKLNIMKLFFSFPSKIFSFWCLFVCRTFPILDNYIYMSRHWKATIRSKWTFSCVYLYVCNDPELETAYKQAPKTGFILNISLGKEKRSFIMFSLWEKARIYDHFQRIMQKLVSITNYECNVKRTKTVLMRIDVLKNLNFYYVHDVSQNQFHFKICTFHMVTTSAQNKILESCIEISILTKQYIWKHQKSDNFYWIICRDFQSSDIGYNMPLCKAICPS